MERGAAEKLQTCSSFVEFAGEDRGILPGRGGITGKRKRLGEETFEGENFYLYVHVLPSILAVIFIDIEVHVPDYHFLLGTAMRLRPNHTGLDKYALEGGYGFPRLIYGFRTDGGESFCGRPDRRVRCTGLRTCSSWRTPG